MSPSQRRSIRRHRFRRIGLLATLWLCGDVRPPLLFAATVHAPKREEVSPDPPTQTAGGSANSAIVTAVISEIKVDGLLDEPIWHTAPTIGELTQRQPRTGEKPTEKTDVTLLHDANYLYIGVMCYDSQPERVIGTQMVRDANLNRDDSISILLDTYRDQRNAFYFSTNPAGSLVDGLVFANGQSNMDWDSIWTVRTRRTDRGWSAEFAIPFKSLGFPAGSTVWGFNVSRNIQRKLEEDRWSGARLELQFFQVSEAGEITNLDGLTQGGGLEFRPFAAGSWLHRGADGDDTVAGKPGFDMFYNLTPSLKLTATVNTDFGETEVDARQINLSRFSLFFPEKRTFFLEDAGVFSFSNTAVNEPVYLSSTNSEVIPFFSRQIGLVSGEEVPLDAGVKLTGKLGRTEVGVLDVRTGDLPVVSAKNLFVARAKRNFLQQSYIGTIFTSGHPARRLSSRTFGTDARLATSHFLGGSRNLIVNAYGLRSMNEGDSGRNSSYGVTAEYPNDKIEMEFRWRDVQENFRPMLGFVSRRNVRLVRIGGRYNPRPKRFLRIQQMFNGAFYNRFTRLDNGQVESWNVLFTVPIDWHFDSGDALHALFSPDIRYERLFAPFEIYRGVVLPTGEYRFTRWITQINSAAKRRVQASMKWLLGTYWSGHADEVMTTLAISIPPRFNFSFNTNQTFARLPEGNFAARIISSQISYSASPFLTFSNLIQYDNLSRNIGWQSRQRWIVRPGTDLFLVFSQGWMQDAAGGYRFSAQDRKVSAKIQSAFRF